MPMRDDWLLWKEKCALALCPKNTQAELRRFVQARFSRYIASYAAAYRGLETEALFPTPEQSWHWMETYFQLHRSRQGKSYKDWLFARASIGAAPAAESIESGISLLLRDVVRERLRSEYPSAQTLSLSTRTSAPGRSSLSVDELLPCSADTLDEVETADISGQAARLTQTVFNDLSLRQRIAILGREMGLPLSRPALLKAASCAKSALSAAHEKALLAVARHAADAWPSEPQDMRARLAIALFDSVRQRIFIWASVENGLPEFLTIVKEPIDRRIDQGIETPEDRM